MSIAVLITAVAVAVGAAALAAYRTLRTRARAGGALAIGAGILTLLAALWLGLSALDRETGASAPSWTWLAQHLLALATAALITGTFVRAANVKWARMLPALLLVPTVIASEIMVTAYAADPDASDWRFGTNGRVDGGGIGSADAHAAFIAFGCALLLDVTLLLVLSLRMAIQPGAQRWLRIGMLVHATGEVPLVAYCLHMIGYSSALSAGIQPSWREGAVDDRLMPIGCILILIGLSSASLSATTQFVADYRSCFRLHPLVRDLAAVLPTALGPRPTRSARWCPWRPLRRLYTLMIQLTDGQGLARAAAPAELTETARHTAHHLGFTGPAAAAFVDAVELTAGLRRLAAGHPRARFILEKRPDETFESWVAHWERVSHLRAHHPGLVNLASTPHRASTADDPAM